MSLQPRRNSSDDLESLDPIDLLPANGPQSLHAYFAEQQNPILHYWQILRKRKWVVLATFAIIFALSVIATLNTTRLYQATSRVAIFPENSNVLGFKDMESSSPDYEYEATLGTQVAILRSDALALKVIEAMRLYQDPRFAAVTQVVPDSSLQASNMQPDPAQAAGLLGAFRSGLNVQLVPNSRLIQLSYTHTDPQFATQITNTLVKTFIEENFRTKYESVTQTSEWLSRELADLQLKVQTAEEKLVRYQKDHSILGVDEKQARDDRGPRHVHENYT
jgi:succinoglycan biosynthesis transport protein ExoP